MTMSGDRIARAELIHMMEEVRGGLRRVGSEEVPVKAKEAH